MSSFDGLSLTNTRDGVFNRLALVYNNDIIDIFNIFALRGDITSITGLPPSTLNTLQELAAAINNDPDFFEYIREQLTLKRNISDSYDKNYIDTLIASYNTKTQNDTLLNNKLNASVIDNYYTKTQSSNLYVNIGNYNVKVAELSSAIGLKANSSELIDYYNKLTTNSLLESYYNKTYIDTKFLDYYTSNDINTLLDTNYYDISYINGLHQAIVSSMSDKADKTELDNFYTKSTTNSLLDNYYNKTTLDNKFNTYYTITGVNSLLTNKVDATTLNNYYDKTYINNSFTNYYQKYQVDGFFNG